MRRANVAWLRLKMTAQYIIKLGIPRETLKVRNRATRLALGEIRTGVGPLVRKGIFFAGVYRLRVGCNDADGCNL